MAQKKRCADCGVKVVVNASTFPPYDLVCACCEAERQAFVDEAEEVSCPLCGCGVQSIGNLGVLAHYRCRACGMYCSKEQNQRIEKQVAVMVAEGGR